MVSIPNKTVENEKLATEFKTIIALLFIFYIKTPFFFLYREEIHSRRRITLKKQLRRQSPRSKCS